MTYTTREEWLSAAISLFHPHFERLNAPLPGKIRVTCGFPSKSALSRKNRRIGECWSPKASADSTTEIMISPTLGQDRVEILGVLAHELCHAAVGLDAGHKGPFKRLATSLKLEGKMAATKVGDAFKLHFAESMLTTLGPYPHGPLNPSQKEAKKQSTRMLKCVCPDCGYTVRTTAKWLDDIGPPFCPDGMVKMELEITKS